MRRGKFWNFGGNIWCGRDHLFPGGVEFVVPPIDHVVLDVGGNAVHFGQVANNAVVETIMLQDIP